MAGIESERLARPQSETYAFEQFGEFLLLFAEVCRTLATPADFARIGRDYVADAAAQGVRYAEIFISPSVWTFFHRNLDVEETIVALRAALDDEGRDHDLEVALICDLTRNFGVERALETARIAADLAEAGLGVVGIGLGGDEANYPASLFREPYEFARARGLHRVVHAGEAAGPGSVRDALDVLGAERIGHGVRALVDPQLVRDLAERRVALELCPTSNRLTGAVVAGVPHPIGALDAAGVLCTIDADDPALFSTTPLNSENASPFGTFTVYLSCAAMAQPPMTASTPVNAAIIAILLHFIEHTLCPGISILASGIRGFYTEPSRTGASIKRV